MGIFATPNLLQEVEQQKQQAFIQAVNEVYFGRTAGINRVFNAYCDWREPFVSGSKFFTATPKNMYNDNMRTFRKLVCEQFGFKSFSYNIISTKMVNSFTMGTAIPLLRVKEYLIVDKNGYRFSDKTDVSSIICVFPDLVFSPEYTNEENFAIFLHEVGHNFQTAASNIIFSLQYALGLFRIFYAPGTILTYNNLVYKGFNFIQNKLSDITILGQMYSLFSTILYVLTYVRSIIMGIQNLLIMPLAYVLSFLGRFVAFLQSLIFGTAVSGYLSERFADGFAASYGFGEALASALNKMNYNIFSSDDTIDSILSKFPLLSHIMEALCIPGMMLVGLIDVHPNTADRCYSIIKDMRHDLNDPSLSPEMKKQLEKDIDSYEKYMKQYFDTNLKYENPRLISTYIQRWIYEKDGGVKFKLSEMPFKKYGGFRGEQDKTIANAGKYNDHL